MDKFICVGDETSSQPMLVVYYLLGNLLERLSLSIVYRETFLTQTAAIVLPRKSDQYS